MDSFQRKFGHSVIESIRIESNNIGVPTLVVGMAVFALHAGNIGNDAVKATLSDDGFLDILVTEEAQIILPLFSECTVAFVAVRFELRMALHDWTRRHQ